MSQTATELQAEIRGVRNRIRCVLSDRSRDSRHVAKAYHDYVTPLKQQLARLNERLEHAEIMIAVYQARVQQYKQRLTFAEADRGQIKAAIRLVERYNSLEENAMQRLELKIDEKIFQRDQVLDYKTFIVGYQYEIMHLRSLLNDPEYVERKRAELQSKIDAADRCWDLFSDSILFGDHILDTCYERLNSLQKLLADEAGRQDVKKAESKVNELNTLFGELGQMDQGTAQQLVDALAEALKKIAGLTTSTETVNA